MLFRSRLDPVADSITSVTFTYTVEDGTQSSGTAVMTTSFSNTNDLPANAGDTASFDEDNTYSGWGAATDWGYSDADSDTMTKMIVWTLPGTGTLTNNGAAVVAESTEVTLANLASGHLLYTPVANANGDVTFTYKVHDDTGYSPEGTMTMTINAVNDAPVIASGANTGAVTEAATGTTDTATGDLASSDTEGSSMTWSCTSCTDDGDTQSLTDVYGAWVLTEATGVWLYTLNNADAQIGRAHV